MVSYLEGKIVSVDTRSVTIQSGGIGFSVQTASPENFQKDSEAKVLVHMHWNQDNGPSLFGFASDLEKQVFLLVISCSGMGPKIGLALLSQLSPGNFLSAVQEGNHKALSTVTGIGPKKAEQMVVQLRSKVAKLLDEGLIVADSGAVVLEQWKNVGQVLKSLNYSRLEIDAALAHLRKEHGGSNASFDELIRAGLSFLAKRV
jgi:holliday junction DNA helicase RuvA